MSETTELTPLQRNLLELDHMTPSLEYKADPQLQLDIMKVSLPYGKVFAELYPSSQLVYIHYIQVNEDYHNHGIGSRLMRNVTAEAKARGGKLLQGSIGNPAALQVRAKLFGETNLNYFASSTGEHMNFTFEEALRYVEHRDDNLDVLVDLEAIDTSTWERPQIKAP